MSEATEVSSKKPKTEVTLIKMEDGREVGFAGNRKMVKDYILDESKIVLDGDTLVLSAGAISTLIDFRNGKSVKLSVPLSLVPQGCGHGFVQKQGDEAASEKEVDDAYLAVEELTNRLANGDWTVEREAGGFSGASVVIQAILEAKQESDPTYTIDKVKEGLQKILDADKAKADAEGRKPMTRNALYASFRNPTSKVGKIVKRLEEEKAAKANNAVNADEALAALG